ncbi:MAG: cytochrome c biogenesis protein CcsA [Ignavibacteria bacterium]|nr:cytochrome c biogenesis protein CcsA [Ignavibacteria bacterium]MBI3765360.1 cytochrome c biogenesis protein CcsA [Ignavibacteriales bacterium]
MALKIFLGLWLSAVIVVAFVFPIVSHPARWYEFPVVPGLEDKARILFFHVPMSWTAVVAFIVSMAYAIKYLAKKKFDDDIISASSAGLGFMFCILATVTGSLWAKFNWGSFWNWDPRETSIFALLLIYGAYFALRSALDVEEKRATLSAVYSIIAGVTVPFFIFIMPRIVSSLHPDPIVNTRGKIDMNSTMLVVFLCSLAGFTALYLWMLRMRVRAERLDLNLQSKGE